MAANQIFISYSRKNSDFAHRITDRLAEEKMDAWVDWQDIPPSVDWMNEIQHGIEEADIFLFLVSPDSIASSVCAEEVEHAVKNGKRIIPIIVREIDAESAPATITHLNWIFFGRPQDNFEESFEKLLTAIRTDYDWVQAHRRLQVKALEWERNQREASFLLRGKDLQDAQAQLTVNGKKPPRPTDLQREYLAQSQASETEELERQRAKEQQIEIEEKLGTRLSRLAYLTLGIFTVAFIALFFWLNQVVRDLAVSSLENQMLALVQTSVCFINVNIDGYQQFLNTYSAGDTAVYNSDWYGYMTNIIDDIKQTNKNINAKFQLYIVTQSPDNNQFLIVASTNTSIDYKTPIKAGASDSVPISGMQATAVNTHIYTDQYGSWMTVCSPIRDTSGTSLGALCADFDAQLLIDTRQNVTYTLGIAFIAIYPLILLLILMVIRNARKARLRVLASQNSIKP